MPRLIEGDGILRCSIHNVNLKTEDWDKHFRDFEHLESGQRACANCGKSVPIQNYPRRKAVLCKECK